MDYMKKKKKKKKKHTRIFGYRPRYYLLHPHTAIQEIGDFFLAFIQRGRRGYADADVWNMDHYLAHVIGPMLRDLANDSHGCPAGFGLEEEGTEEDIVYQEVGGDHEAWQRYLHELASAFDAYLEMQEGDDCYSTPAYAPILERMKQLFDQYYLHLWS